VSYQLKETVYGAEAGFSTFRPKLEQRDHSIIQMAIITEGASKAERQKVEAGWMRSPSYLIGGKVRDSHFLHLLHQCGPRDSHARNGSSRGETRLLPD